MRKTVAAFIVAAGMLIAASSFAGRQDSDSTRKYAEGVSLLNLLNGLNLSSEQMHKILDLNKELKTLRDDAFDGPKVKAMESEKEDALNALYTYLMNNPEREDKAIQDRASKAEQKLKEYRDGVFKQLSAELERISKEVEGSLSSQQLDVVNDFKPCIVPPKDMRDPVRAGQAKSDEATVKALEKARELSKAKGDVDSFAQKVADKAIEHSEKKAKLSADEEKSIRNNVVATIKQAVKLSDTDFEIQKPLLAQKIEPVNKMEELKEEMNKRNPHADPLQNARGSKVVQFLVNPDTVIPVLEKRLQTAIPGGLKGANQTPGAKSATTTNSVNWQ